MCGIFGIIATDKSNIPISQIKKTISSLFKLSESRGKEASGIAFRADKSISVIKSPIPGSKMIKSKKYTDLFNDITVNQGISDNGKSFCIFGHSRLVTNGQSEINSNNQPVVKDGIVGIHNGIIVNDDLLWKEYPSLTRNYNVDTEVFLSIMNAHRNKGNSLVDSFKNTFGEIEGAASIALFFDNINYVLLGTNTGSLYILLSPDNSVMIFASEKAILLDLLSDNYLKSLFNGVKINQLKPGMGKLVNIHNLNISEFSLSLTEENVIVDNNTKEEILPIIDCSEPDVNYTNNNVSFVSQSTNDKMMSIWESLYSDETKLKRCTKCLLPHTFPYIEFDDKGVCNFCRDYEKRGNSVKGESVLDKKLEKYRNTDGEPDCLIGFSGGRDSSYGLWYLKNKMNLNPITFIYDWGMVTDLARRNQARVCGKLGIEQIVVSANIKRKRENIRKNLEAWLKRPELGMVPILMAGDKAFYHYFHKIRKDNNIDLFIFCGGYEGEESTGIFKLGFCGVNRNENSAQFRMTGINISNKLKLLRYYAKNYILNPSYINSSIFDTLVAYYTSYILPDDYVYLYNYIEWDEDTIISRIRDEYDWELENDTIATWRTDDGTAALYNYIYMVMAGFTEFDAIRSYQIREGKLSRDEAFKLVKEENKPRVPSLEWYGNAVNIDVNRIIETINKAPRLY